GRLRGRAKSDCNPFVLHAWGRAWVNAWVSTSPIRKRARSFLYGATGIHVVFNPILRRPWSADISCYGGQSRWPVVSADADAAFAASIFREARSRSVRLRRVAHVESAPRQQLQRGS